VAFNLFKRASALTEQQRERRANILEGANAVLLGLAAVATAFAGYRSAILGGDAIKDYTTAVRTVSDANQAYTEGNQVYQLDQAIFLEYVKALNSDDVGLAEYFKTLARPQLVKAIDWWLESGDEGPDTPFVDENPEYTIEQYDNASVLQEETDALFASGERNDDRGDRFDLVVAMFATTLFLYGISAVSKSYEVQLTALTGGTVMFAAGLAYMAFI
jgi:hypothetical protein